MSDDLPVLSSAGMDSERDSMAKASLPRRCGVRRPSRPAGVPAGPTPDLTVAALKKLADRSAALKQLTPHITGRPNQALQQKAGHVRVWVSQLTAAAAAEAWRYPRLTPQG